MGAGALVVVVTVDVAPSGVELVGTAGSVGVEIVGHWMTTQSASVAAEDVETMDVPTPVANRVTRPTTSIAPRRWLGAGEFCVIRSEKVLLTTSA